MFTIQAFIVVVVMCYTEKTKDFDRTRILDAQSRQCHSEKQKMKKPPLHSPCSSRATSAVISGWSEAHFCLWLFTEQLTTRQRLLTAHYLWKGNRSLVLDDQDDKENPVLPNCSAQGLIFYKSPELYYSSKNRIILYLILIFWKRIVFCFQRFKWERNQK